MLPMDGQLEPNSEQSLGLHSKGPVSGKTSGAGTMESCPRIAESQVLGEFIKQLRKYTQPVMVLLEEKGTVEQICCSPASGSSQMAVESLLFSRILLSLAVGKELTPGVGTGWPLDWQMDYHITWEVLQTP